MDMTPEDFITKYENALATQKWNNVEPLIHGDACVTFSNGIVNKGKVAIQMAYERNFSLIKNEKYSISNVYWAVKNDSIAVYLFDFSWKGLINDKEAEGNGCGTTTLINVNGEWKLISEHLGKKN
jgi:hypothetical protein